MPQENERMDMWYLYTMEYCLAIKSNKVLIHTKTGIYLENIMLNKTSPS